MEQVWVDLLLAPLEKGDLFMEERIHKNFMMIKNKFWEALYEIEIPCQHRRVFDYIYRQTKGWGAEYKDVSTYEIATKLGIPGSSVRRIKRALIQWKLVAKKGKLIGIQMDFTLWKVGRTSPIEKVGRTGDISRTSESVLLGPVRPLIKETLKEKKKERVFTKPKDEEDREKFRKKLHEFTEGIGNMPGLKK